MSGTTMSGTNNINDSRNPSTSSTSSTSRTLRKNMEHFVAPVANTILTASEKIHESLSPVHSNINNTVIQPFATNVNDIIASRDKSIAIAPRWLTNEQDQFMVALSCGGFYRRLVSGAAMRYIYGIGLQLQIVDTFLNTLSLINALIVTIPFGVMSMYGADFWDSLEQSMKQHGCGSQFDDVYNSIRGNINAVLCFSLIPLLITTLYYIVRPSNFGEVPEDETLVKITNDSRLIYQEEGNEVDIDNQTNPIILQRIQVALQMASLKSQDQMHNQEMSHEDRVRAIITTVVLEARQEQRQDRQNFYYWWQRARIAIFMAFATTMGSVTSLFSMAAQIMAYYAVRPSHVCDGAGAESAYYLGFAIPLLLIALYVLL